MKKMERTALRSYIFINMKWKLNCSQIPFFAFIE